MPVAPTVDSPESEIAANATAGRNWLWLRRLMVVGIAIGCALLFVHEPGPEQHRLMREFWDQGHLILFGIVGFFAGERLWMQPWRKFLLCLVLAAGVGWLIEVMQYFIGRDYSLGDVYADCVGMSLGLLIGGRARLRRYRWLFRAAAALVISLILLQLKTPVLSAVDAVNAWRTFPVLANFENGAMPQLQRDRFFGIDAALSVDRGALRVKLRPGLYPGFVLDDFPNDWRGYHVLVLDVENPDKRDLSLICRIHDAGHNWQHADRYNRRFDVAPGRHQIRIDLGDVEQAPQGRLMNMAEIRAPQCFSYQLAQPRELRIFRVDLE